MNNGDAPRPLGREALTECEWEAVAMSLNLTSQQIVSVKGVFDNHTKERIAKEIDRSPHTVDMHLRLIYARLDVSSQAQLVQRILVEHLNLQEGATL